MNDLRIVRVSEGKNNVGLVIFKKEDYTNHNGGIASDDELIARAIRSLYSLYFGKDSDLAGRIETHRTIIDHSYTFLRE